MKIVLTGGGTGGHFYPLIAIAEELQKEARQNKLLDAKLYYMAPTPYHEARLFDNDITFVRIPAGKRRLYFSVANFFDLFVTALGILVALWKMFTIFPDVVFAKGGYASYPALFAARFFGIPVVIHESDSVPGRVNLWAGKFAKKIALSYPSAAEYFPKGKTAYTGNPVRRELMTVQKSGGHEFLKLEESTPTLLILGGSLGSEVINDVIIDSLPGLISKYQIIHQTGKANYNEILNTSKVILKDNEFEHRYHPFDYLNDLAMQMSAGSADLIISRAGSTIFEIAVWGIPSILIPITDSQGDHQRKNAYAYARSGAAVIIEEANLNSHILSEEIRRLMENPAERERMKEMAKGFARLDSAEVIAKEIIQIGLGHEK
ncbi:MAG: UDP-N-acetylglucosamine--N-acetylmuramyl-(pentapeptide) pyrophosphoryl-undecaprenol N-acetylglucosamine transferase [Candidatus Pacebacteria bacterium]|nr:UDP-N-acetylglucosamine--N-acetylmuramyl-(pentapeptide) pyrophosphoryl-undecaprenol N-acetylglucosamine transferase [Candidatus Paceibacterota bacterium]MDD5357126.1 UDP-N-acetylglucosamine--N-acetylmuramyl-(pentapeptide) pyrophosphoryl-undecaprenol N-acetylglucosamine transferase [Candidatus Paceibacterota bacterium]